MLSCPVAESRTYTAETGTLLGEFPYVRVGGGDRPLVLFPGVGDAMFSGNYGRPVAWMLRWAFQPYLDEHTVYVLSRPRGLPADHRADEMAADYARVLDAEIGPADVVGLSLGGFLAQSLALRRPDLVRDLVLASTGARMGERGFEDTSRFREAASRRDWPAIRAGLNREMFSGPGRFVLPIVTLTAGRPFVTRPAVPSDVDVSLATLQEFDSRDRLGEIDARTIVVAGDRDPYFPEPIQRELADGIPDAELTFISGGRHGAVMEQKPAFDAVVTSFLE